MIDELNCLCVGTFEKSFVSEFQFHLKRFIVSLEVNCHSKNTFVYERSRISLILSKRAWKALFEQDASDKSHSKFEKFSISTKISKQTGCARYYVEFENGEIAANATLFNVEFHISMGTVANFKISLSSSTPESLMVNHIRTFSQSNNKKQLRTVNIFTDDMNVNMAGPTYSLIRFRLIIPFILTISGVLTVLRFCLSCRKKKRRKVNLP